MTDTDNQPPSKRAQTKGENLMGGRTPHEGPSFPRVEVTGITLTKTRQTDSAAWDFFVAHCEAEGITIREAGSGTIAAAMTAYADAATSTLLDEIKARVRGLKREAVVRETPGTFSENKGRNAALNEVLAAIKEVRHG